MTGEVRTDLVAIGLNIITLALVVSLWLFSTGSSLTAALQWAWVGGLAGAAIVAVPLLVALQAWLAEVRSA